MPCLSWNSPKSLWSDDNLALRAIPTFCVEGQLKILGFLLILYWFGDKVIKNKKSWSRVAKTCLFWQNYQLYEIQKYFQHRSQWSICNTYVMAHNMLMQKSEYANILDLSFLCEHLLIDATHRKMKLVSLRVQNKQFLEEKGFILRDTVKEV